MCLNLYVIMEMQIQTTRMTKVNTTVRQFQMLSEDVKQIEPPTSSGESEHWGHHFRKHLVSTYSV